MSVGTNLQNYSSPKIVDLICSSILENNANLSIVLKGQRKQLNVYSSDGLTPFLCAVKTNRGDLVKTFVKQKVDVNLGSKRENESPLHVACWKGYVQLVRFLIKKGADVNAVKNDGETPLFSACRKNRKSIVEILIENDADITIRNKEEKLAYDYTKMKTIIDLFLKNPKMYYTILHKVGTGGYGKVFKAINECNKEIIAVKKVFIDDKDDIESIEKEITMMKSLMGNINIIKYLGFEKKNIDSENFVYIFMEFCSNGTLRDMFENIRHDRIEKRIFLVQYFVRQILSGIHFLHKQGIIHRDIKPSNVLLDDRLNVKLSDFGCSKTLLQPGMVSYKFKGTTAFMAPEMMLSKNRKVVPTKLDVWSLGITMLFLLGNIWEGIDKTDNFGLIFHISRLTEPPKAQVEITNPDCADFIDECVMLDPDDRASVDDLLEHSFIEDDLEDFNKDIFLEDFKKISSSGDAELIKKNYYDKKVWRILYSVLAEEDGEEE